MTSVFCDPCIYRKSNTTAIKYCHLCRESFCKGCAEVHKSCKATRTHFLIDASDSFVSSKFNKELENVQTCLYHDKSLDFYCGDHKAFLCSMCVLFAEDHSKCGKLVDITIAGEKLMENRFTDKVGEEMQHVKSQTEKAVESLRNALSKSEKSKDNMTEQLQMFADSLQNLTDVVKIQVSQIEVATADQFKDHEEKCLNTIHNLEKLKDSADNCDKLSKLFHDIGSSADVFRSAFVIEEQCKQFIDEVDSIKDDASVIKVVVEKSDIVEKLENCNKPLFRCKTSRVDVQIKPLTVRENLKQAIERSLSGCSVNDCKRVTNECTWSLADSTCNSHLTEMPFGKNEVDTCYEEPKPRYSRDTHAITGAVQVVPDENPKHAMEKKGIPVNATKNSKTVRNTLMSSDVYESEVLYTREHTQHVNESPETTQQDEVPVTNLTEQMGKRTIEIKYIESLDVSSSTDLAPPKFVGILCLFDGRLVLSDSQNARLLVVNDSGRVLNELFTPFLPKCLASVSKARFAVSMLKDNRIAFIKIKGLNTKDISYIKTRYHTKGIKRIDQNRMLVIMTDREDMWHMDIIHMNGTLIQTINVNHFYDGYYAAIQHFSDQDKFHIIYGSDLFNVVKCCDSTGTFVFKYNVSAITSVITDGYGYVYIIRMNGEIVILTPNGQLFKTEKIANLLKPNCTSFDSTHNKLYITTYQSSKIQVLNVGRSFDS